MNKLQPNNIFATPESQEALQDYIESHSAPEKRLLYTGAMMAWNLAAKLTETKMYYSLAIKWDTTWEVEFGDYDLSTVEAELETYSDYMGAVILYTPEDQETINQAVKKLNGEVK